MDKVTQVRHLLGEWESARSNLMNQTRDEERLGRIWMKTSSRSMARSSYLPVGQPEGQSTFLLCLIPLVAQQGSLLYWLDLGHLECHSR
jgi:hypothetical protein